MGSETETRNDQWRKKFRALAAKAKKTYSISLYEDALFFADAAENGELTESQAQSHYNALSEWLQSAEEHSDEGDTSTVAGQKNKKAVPNRKRSPKPPRER